MKIVRFFLWIVLVVMIALVGWFSFAYWTSTNDCGKAAAANGSLMKAIVYCEYGPPDVLKLEDIPKPVPNDDQVLIKVHAASANPYDWHFMRGEPRIARMEMGLRKPKETRFGVDYSGTVEAVGKNVTKVKVGDEVFGAADGAFAEYVCPLERGVVAKPSNVRFEQAACLPIAGATALQAVRDRGKVGAGQKVLINGASGGVGTFAVQIAKSYGADVTGVCSGRNAELVTSLGADRVIDYTRQDFTEDQGHYDVIIDNVGNRSLRECRRALQPTGIYIMIGGQPGPWIAPMDRALGAWITSMFVKQKMGMMLAHTKTADLATLARLLQNGKLKAVIDRTYKLTEAPEAIRYLEQGHARGKVVIAIE